MIDFEGKFAAYLHEYAKKKELNDEKLDQEVPELYLEWLDTPKKWLKGKTPVEHFKSYEASELIEQLGGYIMSGVTLPGPLLNQIADTKQETYPYLINLLKNYEGEKACRIKHTIVRLIEEMDLAHPYEYYIEVISTADDQDDFVENVAEELKNCGDRLVDELITAYEKAKNDYVSDCLLDILCDVSFNERVYQFALEKFLYSDRNRAFYASCLGKLSNQKAMPYLEDSLKEDDLGYYDYIAIKNAIEELGGEVTIDRDFTGDRDYECLKHLEE